MPTMFQVIRTKSFPMLSVTEFLQVLSYIGSSLWNNLDKSLKTSVSLNAFKHNFKDQYLRKGNKKD